MRFYCESIEAECFLDPVESGHLCRVLRAKKGAAVELFDGKGTLGTGTVERADSKRAAIRVHEITTVAPATYGRIVLAVSFAKGQRFDWLVEKCTELGVDHIAAVQFERTVKLGKHATIQRCEKISISAAKQSKRLFLPKLTGPEKFPATLDLLQRQYPDGLFIYGDPNGISMGNLPNICKDRDCIFFIGPEGGFTDQELALLKTHPVRGVVINRNTLRIETAATAFCAAAAASRL
ncbi:MAG: RsmE family RNA methyltransferase [Planctomycetota bacterium]|jgi:16S rRNA (uracil1498-N3)-methyltransferase